MTDDDLSTAAPSFPLTHYRQLAELRFRIRRFLQFSEQVARTHGLEPQQHQLMITIKGLPESTLPTVSALAGRLCLRHHSTVELINRLVERGAAVRKPSQQDRRQVLVELTPVGEELLAKLSMHHTQELQTCAPELLTVMTDLIQSPGFENHVAAENHEYKTAAAQATSSAADSDPSPEEHHPHKPSHSS